MGDVLLLVLFFRRGKKSTLRVIISPEIRRFHKSPVSSSIPDFQRPFVILSKGLRPPLVVNHKAFEDAIVRGILVADRAHRCRVEIQDDRPGKRHEDG